MVRITDTVKHLIIINVLVFIATQLLLTKGIFLDDYFALYYYKNPLFQPWQLLTTMFMHANVQHLLFNMLALWMFGSAIEQVWGKKRFLVFYFVCGLGASLIYTLVNFIQFQPIYGALINQGLSESLILEILNTGKYNSSILNIVSVEDLTSVYQLFTTPAVGASGAITGVLVAFGMLFPNAELMMLLFPVPVKAKYFIPIMIGMDLFSGLTGISILGATNTAYWAHLGGAIVGLILLLLFKSKQFNKYRWD